MKFIKEELKKLNKNYVKFYNNFKIINILIVLFTLYAMIFNFEEYLFIAYAFTIMLPIVFYAEYSHKKLMYVIALILGIISGILLSGKPPVELVLFYIGVVIILFTLDFYIIIRREKSLPKYLCKLFENLLQIYIIYSILAFGLIILFLLTDYMIFNDKLTDYIYVIYYLVTGVYLIPSVIMSLVYNDDKFTVLIDILISKVLMIIMNIYFLIVIVYVFKGLFTLNYSIYSVYMIIGCLFLLFLPLSIMADNYKGKYYEFNSKWLKYIFIIPLILQIYVLFNQVHDYGFTITRYVGLMFVLFEVFALGLLIYKDKKYIVESLLVFCSLVFIMFIIPGCNIRDAVINSQVNRLTNIYTNNMTFNSLSVTDKNRVKNIYDYIVDMDDKSKYKLPDYIDKDAIDKYEVKTLEEFNSAVAVNEDQKIDISKYKYLEEIMTNGKIDKISIKGTNYNFTSYGKYGIENGDEAFNKYVEKHALVHLNDKYDFYIKYIMISKENEKYIVDSLEGYVLYK